MFTYDFATTDINLVMTTTGKMPDLIILDAALIVRKIQSVFPHYDVTPFISTLIDDFSDTENSAFRLRKTITYYLDALSENDLHFNELGRPGVDKRVNLIAGLPHAITLEQAAMDLLDMINQLRIRVVDRFLVYKFVSLNADSSINLYRIPCDTFENFCDEMAR